MGRRPKESVTVWYRCCYRPYWEVQVVEVKAVPEAVPGGLDKVSSPRSQRVNLPASHTSVIELYCFRS